MSVGAWSAAEEGYLRAYEWAGALAGGAALPQEPPAMPLGPGEVAHAHFVPVALSAYFGEQKEYSRSWFLIGGPVGLALTGAASYANNARTKAEAQRAASPRWHDLGNADAVVTNQRLVLAGHGQAESYWYAQTGPLTLVAGPGGGPAVQFQPAGAPVLQLASPFAPLLYVFVHHLVDGRPPGVPMPPGLVERARAQGRIR